MGFFTYYIMSYTQGTIRLWVVLYNEALVMSSGAPHTPHANAIVKT